VSFQTALERAAAKFNLPVDRPLAVRDALREALARAEEGSLRGPPLIRLMHQNILCEAGPWLPWVELAADVHALVEANSRPAADLVRLRFEAQKIKTRLDAQPAGDERELLTWRLEELLRQALSPSAPPPAPVLQATPPPLPPPSPPPPAPPPKIVPPAAKLAAIPPSVPRPARLAAVVPSRTLPPFRPLELANVLVLTTPGAGIGGVNTLRFLSTPTLTIGRQPKNGTAPDFAVSGADPSLKVISRRHVQLARDGSKITVSDGSSAEHPTNGSNLDGTELGQVPLPLVADKEHTLVLAGALTLQIRKLESVAPLGPTVASEYEEDDSTRRRVQIGGCLRLISTHSTLASQRTVWVFSDAAIGGASGCGLILTGHSHGYGTVHFHRGAFWWENTSGASDGVIDGCPVAPGEAIPLFSDQTLLLGGEHWTVQLSRKIG
jgi:hypothetical protein